jgi:hypothetical protein
VVFEGNAGDVLNRKEVFVMRNTLTALLAAVLIIALCACSVTDSDNNSLQETQTTAPPQTQPQASEPTPPQTVVTTNQTTSTTEQNIPITQAISYESANMPIPFKHMCGDENGKFFNRYNLKMWCFSMVEDRIIRYISHSSGLSVENVEDELIKKWEGLLGYYALITGSKLTEIASLYWYIVEYDIPDDVVIEAIRNNNEHFERVGGYENRIYSDEDIDALLTRDEAIITAQFAEDVAIVIEDRTFSPAWLYLHTAKDYEEVGITPEMVREKLPLWSEFELTEEADATFSEKLSEFMGEEISLRKIRERN